MILRTILCTLLIVISAAAAYAQGNEPISFAGKQIKLLIGYVRRGRPGIGRAALSNATRRDRTRPGDRGGELILARATAT